MARERCITVVPKLHELAVITRLGALGSRAEIAELFCRMHQVVRRTLTIRANRRPRLLFSADARGRTICVTGPVDKVGRSCPGPPLVHDLVRKVYSKISCNIVKWIQDVMTK